ncbi:hypothetical protein M0804_011224 [Polistes exclamans]|nr:hypothetical protein M0804_011224 [Polistes exclamans]
MDKKSSSKTLKDILRPYHVLTTIFGLRVLKLPSGKTNIKLNVIYSIILFLFYNASWKYVSSKNRLLNLSNTEYNLMCTLSVIIVIIAMVVGLCKNQQWESSMRSLEEIDKTLQLLGSNSRFHKIYIRTMIEFIFFMTYFFILMCLDVYITNESLNDSNIDKLPTLFFVGFNIYGETVANTVVLEFLTIVRCIKSELERANDLLSDINILPCSSIALELMKYKGKENSLKNLINVLPSSRRKNSRTDVNEQILIRSRQLLQTIRQIHLELYKVSKNTSNLYNIQTSIVISLYFFYNTCFFYSLYLTNKNYENSNDILYKEFASIPHFVISTIFKLIFLNYTCDETTQKMEQVNEIMYTFYGESTDNMIQQEVKMFTLQTAHCQSTYIKIKFNELNGLLEKMLTTTVDLPQHTKVLKMKDNWEDDSSLSIIYRTYKANENLIKLKRIKQIHLELMKSSKIINEAYGLPIFISVIEATSFTITLFYNLYNLIILNKLNYFILDFYTNLYWIFVYAFKIFLISNICETAITEAGNTGNILCELYEPSTSKKFREQIRDFMFQLIRNRLTFTACGFFDLDHTFLYSVIGSITTYLVILIQVGDEPNTYYNNTNDNSTSNNLS